MSKLKAYIEHHYYLNLIFKIIYSFYQKGGLQKANGLAYVLLMSFVPFFISTASIVSFFVSNKVYNKFEKLIFANYLPVIGDEIAKYMRQFQSHAVGLSIISILFLFVTTISMINTLKNQLDELLEMNSENIHYGIRLFIILLIFVGLIVAGFISLGIRELIHHYLPIKISERYSSILIIFQYITSILAFSLIYKFVPSGKICFKKAFIAGIVGGILFEIAKFGFTIYIKNFATENVLYGSLATIPIFLLWIYIVSLIILFCAQIIPLLDKKNFKKIKVEF